MSETIIVQLRSEDGEVCGGSLEISFGTTSEQLNTIVNQLKNNEEAMLYSFLVDEEEITETVQQMVEKKGLSREVVLPIIYRPQAMFKVRAVTRCTATLPGHTEAVLSVCFSPNGTVLASGSGDTTARLWDLDTSTPIHTCKGHRHWVQNLAISADGLKVASAGMDTDVRVWEVQTGALIGRPLKFHKKPITSLSWEPMHQNPKCDRLASAGQDNVVCIWDVVRSLCLFQISGHTGPLTGVKWGGVGLIYTASRDRTIKVWSAVDGKLCRSLDGHGHWVNTMALSTDFALRTGAFDHTGLEMPESLDERQEKARQRYIEHKGGDDKEERLASGSDDFSIYLWTPASSKKPITRLTGHQQVVYHVMFSPDGRYLASCSGDKSVRLWDGVTGKFITTFRGHVGAVYQVAWSADSRLLVSGSKDSTVKIWEIRTKKLKFDLPGHADEVYTVDWSPDGQKVASGGKDRVLKLWAN